MNKLPILSKVGPVFAKAGLYLKEKSPTILVVGGIVGVVASAVMACFATTKLGDVIVDARKTIDKARTASSSDSSKKELVIAYVKAGARVAKLYLPAVGVGAMSIAGIVSSHNILQRRNAAIVAGYSTLEGILKDYRSGVVQKYGETADRELRYGITKETIEETVVDKNGKETKVLKTVDVVHIDEDNDYIRIFDGERDGYSKIPDEAMLFFLEGVQRGANSRLVALGYITLNDLYDEIGFKRSAAGQMVGWILDTKNPTGDNHIDLRIQQVYWRDEYGDLKRAYLIDPNVDGNILEEAKKRNLLD